MDMWKGKYSKMQTLSGGYMTAHCTINLTFLYI